jgi:hypothetical protein
MPLIAFSESALKTAARIPMIQDQCFALKYGGPPLVGWRRDCLRECESWFREHGSLTSGGEALLFTLDILDQERPF